MPSKHPEETQSRIKRGLNQIDKHLDTAINKLSKPKYHTPQKVLVNLWTAKEWLAREKNGRNVVKNREEEDSDDDIYDNCIQRRNFYSFIFC